MLRSWRAALIVLALVGIETLDPAVALAQACVGLPAADGQFSFAGSAFFTNGTSGVGAKFSSNPDGPFSVQGSYTRYDYDDFERDGNEWGAHLVYEVPDLPVAVCPTVGFQYFRIDLPVQNFETDVQFNTTTVPIGFGVSSTFAAGGSEAFSFTPYVMPSFIYMRAGAQTQIDGSLAFAEPGTANEFSGMGGLVVGFDRLFAGGHASMTTFENDEPVFYVSAGMIF